jgi:hypothetical protein
LIFTKALEEREKEALEEQNNQRPVHEQKKTEKSKRLRTTVTCQTATAWKDKARKKGSSRLETGENPGRDELFGRKTTPSNSNPKQPNLRNENPNRCSCGHEQVLGGCSVFNQEPPVPVLCKEIFVIILVLVLKMRTGSQV